MLNLSRWSVGAVKGRFLSLDCLWLNPIAAIRHHVNEEPVTGAKCRPGIFSCAGNRSSILTCDYVSYTKAGSSCETSIRRKVGGEGNGGVCVCVRLCVCVSLVVRHSVGGLLNPAGYSGLESYRALDLSRSRLLSLFLSFCFWFSHTRSHMHIGIAAETPSPFSLGVDCSILNWTSQSWGRSLSLLDLGEAGYLVTCLISLLGGRETK